jgi:glycosyltransferase involved in cell wall biosynthesis
MNVEIFTVIKDAEYILPFYLEHYTRNFPDCKINIFDNGSTDSSIDLCKEAGCNIIPFFDFVPLVKEHYLTDLKNNVWKTSKADWVIICDVDELIQINSDDLVNLVEVDIVQFRGFNMVDINDKKDPKLFTHGLSAGMYCKACLFRPSIEEINYTSGAHGFEPDSKYKISKFQYRLFHYNRSWFNLENFYVCHSYHPKEVVKDLYLKSLEKVRKLK